MNALPRLLRDTATIVEKEDFQAISYPKIIAPVNAADVLGSGPFKVVLDNEVLAQTDNFVRAYKIMLCAYYIFNINYPKELGNSLLFAQKMLLEIGGSNVQSKKINTLVSRLSKAK